MQREGNEVRITATLVNASDGNVVWTQRYDKPYKDLFALQDAITDAVAAALKARLLTAPGAVVQSDRPPGGNLEPSPPSPPLKGGEPRPLRRQHMQHRVDGIDDAVAGIVQGCVEGVAWLR